MLFDCIGTLPDAYKSDRARIAILSSHTLKGLWYERVCPYIFGHQFFFLFLSHRVIRSRLLYQEDKHDSIEDDFDSWVYVQRVADQMLLLNSAVVAIFRLCYAFLKVEDDV